MLRRSGDESDIEPVKTHRRDMVARTIITEVDTHALTLRVIRLEQATKKA